MNTDEYELTDEEVLEEALLLISTLTDPKAKTPGRHLAARRIFPRLREILSRKTREAVCNDISDMIEEDSRKNPGKMGWHDVRYVLDIIDDYRRLNNIQDRSHATPDQLTRARV